MKNICIYCGVEKATHFPDGPCAEADRDTWCTTFEGFAVQRWTWQRVLFATQHWWCCNVFYLSATPAKYRKGGQAKFHLYLHLLPIVVVEWNSHWRVACRLKPRWHAMRVRLWLRNRRIQ